jgi:hypothetical protein
MKRPPVTIEQILAWADAYFKFHGQWPTRESGRIAGSVWDDTWLAVDTALRKGLRGLPRGLSLPQLLAQYRGVRNRMRLPRLTYKLVLTWMDAQHKQTGLWPTDRSGPVLVAPAEFWGAVDKALRMGHRGLFGGSSLARLLIRHRGVGLYRRLEALTIRKIRGWSKAYRQRTGYLRTAKSGPIPEADGETWNAVALALRGGWRGLPVGLSLPQVLNPRRKIRP